MVHKRAALGRVAPTGTAALSSAAARTAAVAVASAYTAAVAVNGLPES
jgi:hypothetical protein